MPCHTKTCALAALLLAVVVTWPHQRAHGQLRIASYNTLDKPFSTTSDAQFQTIFDAIANKSVNGVAKRVDIVSLQEQTVDTATRIASLLNSLHSVGSYEADVIGFGTDKVAFVYDSSTVEYLDSTLFAVGTRPGHRIHFRPLGYSDSAAELYLYSLHLKAGKNFSDIITRSNEITQVRANADALGADKNILYSGDFNFSRSDEPGYIKLLDTGNGMAVDPLDASVWPTSSQADIVTQSTRTSYLSDGGATGGLDDRFDFQQVTSQLLNGEGLSYLGPTSSGLSGLDHSYQAFGNDGVSYNQAINNTLLGRSQPEIVLDALHDFSDHLPVVADYQLPASMDVQLASVPATANLGELVEIDVAVENIAQVVATLGADELDYTLTVTGDLFGGTSGMALALQGGNIHPITLDTSSAGSKMGLLTVSSISQAVEHGLFSFPISFEVLAGFLEADFNQDQFVNSLDLAQWQQDLGINDQSDADNDGDSDGGDLLIWQRQFGMSSSAEPISRPVPEPNSALLLGIALLPIFCRHFYRPAYPARMAS
jgi:hypothetical protein